MESNKNPYSQKEPLVAQGCISTPFPYSLIFKDSINLYYLENKGIRVGLVDVLPATKGTLENKVSI